MVNNGAMALKRSYRCDVLAVQWLTERVFSLTVRRSSDLPAVGAGQFFQLKSAAPAYLRRPISVSRIDQKTIEFTMIVKGVGTRGLAELAVGDPLDLLGPLGNGYQIDRAAKRVLIVGAGIGVPPQALLAEQLAAKGGLKLTACLGFRDQPYLVDRFTALNVAVKVASECGRADYKGSVVDLTARLLQTEKFDVAYVCGPPIVIQIVAKLCRQYDLPVQLLMEERMACGVGACMVCACKVKSASAAEGYWYKRVCSDGPVFWGSEVLFDE